MLYTFLSSVFITFFFLLAACSFFGFMELWRKNFPLTWACYQHVYVLAILSFVCFILAVIFGILIPDCYAPTKF